MHDIGPETEEQRGKAVWCIAARVGADDHLPGAASATFEPGAKVYCLPPVWGGGYERVKVIGPSRRGGKMVEATVAAKELEQWKAEPVADPDVLLHICPPWDGTDVSRGVAEGLAAWRGGGHWPSLELRRWNRMKAERTVGPGHWFARLRNALARLLGRERG